MNTDKLDKAIARLERAKRLLLNPALRQSDTDPNQSPQFHLECASSLLNQVLTSCDETILPATESYLVHFDAQASAPGRSTLHCSCKLESLTPEDVKVRFSEDRLGQSLLHVMAFTQEQIVENLRDACQDLSHALAIAVARQARIDFCVTLEMDKIISTVEAIVVFPHTDEKNGADPHS